jgi:predicted MFS family arabinose efflux permease
MRSALAVAFKQPSVRVCALAIFFLGFAGAATSPYQSIIGINELGLSDSAYAILMFAAAVVNVSASVVMGILADRLGDYRKSILYLSLFGIAGYAIVYIAASPVSFVISKLLLLPTFGAVYSLIFANVRAHSRGMSSSNLIAVNSTMRAMISLSWVLVPGLVGIALAGSPSMLPAYLLATLAAAMCFILAAFFLPKSAPATHLSDESRYRFLASLKEVTSRRVLLRVVGIALICSMLHVNDAVRPLIITGRAGGTVADIGTIVGIVAALEIIFIVFWGWADRRMPSIAALSLGASLYALYLGLQGLSTATWHVYAQSILSGFAAAAIISLPITYLQDLIADRPGLGSSLISVNIFLSAGLSSVIFALGTQITDYGGTSIFGALFGFIGVVLLVVVDGPRIRR